jgi:hypothetical protein
MANLFDNDVVLEAFEGSVVFRDIPTGTNLLKVSYTGVDPNGTMVAPVGSIASGPTGTWVNTDGATAWSPVGAGVGTVAQIGSVGGAVVTSNSVAIQIAGSVPIAPGALDAVGRTLRCRVGMHCSAKGGIAIPGLAFLFGGTVLPFPSNPTILGKSFVLDLLVRTTVAGVAGSTSFTAVITDMAFAGGPSSGGVLPTAGPIDLTAPQAVEIAVVWDMNNGGLDAVTLDAMVVDLG